MSSLDQLINTVAQRAVEREEASFLESQKNVVEIVRRGYDKWVELFLVLKAKKIGCYAYMVDLLAGPEFRLHTNVAALKQAFAKVRKERGEQRASFTRAPQEVHQNGQRLRYSSAGGAARSDPLPEAQVKRLGPVERLAASVAVPGGVQPGGLRIPSEAGIGEPLGVVWSLEGPCPVFQGVEFPIRAGKLVDKLRTLDGLIATVCRVGSDDDCRSTRTFLVGYLERLGFESYGQEVIEPMDWPQIAKQTLGRLQARI